ncbi:hypothetical protein [Nocardia vaccinii]|uniref:hypothetical protein n=1 Tax=Nocardia vaccinii TaxID=1822 RepID=UPI0012F4EB6B|nr:hypothetical protein [Nocardia vaccinii]
MDGSPDHGKPGNHLSSAGDVDALVQIPEWVPMEPLPSSRMLLSAFAGKALAGMSDILEPAFDLVACREQYRLAFEMLGKKTASFEQLRYAASELVTAQQDTEVLVAIIDDAVAERLKWRPEVPASPPVAAPPDGLALMPVHTQSVGEIAARMADLWDAVMARIDGGGGEDFPEAGQLLELCRGYDCLAAEFESGRRTLPGM